jgi:hypothetical protein
MAKLKLHTLPWVRILVAVGAVTGLLMLPVRELAPGLSLWGLVLSCVAGIGVALAVIAVVAVAWLQVAQFALRHGGTDAQWFWFNGEPPGLVALRRARAAARPPQQGRSAS